MNWAKRKGIGICEVIGCRKGLRDHGGTGDGDRPGRTRTKNAQRCEKKVLDEKNRFTQSHFSLDLIIRPYWF